MLRAAVISSLAMAQAASGETPCETRDWAAHTHGHRDLGAGRVAWMWSWTAEGVADDILVMDCRTGEGLRARARSERMQAPLPYDRRARAQARLDSAASAPAFFRLEALAEAWDRVNVPSARMTAAAEPCACAIYYPGAFPGQKTTRDDR